VNKFIHRQLRSSKKNQIFSNFFRFLQTFSKKFKFFQTFSNFFTFFQTFQTFSKFFKFFQTFQIVSNNWKTDTFWKNFGLRDPNSASNLRARHERRQSLRSIASYYFIKTLILKKCFVWCFCLIDDGTVRVSTSVILSKYLFWEEKNKLLFWKKKCFIDEGNVRVFTSVILSKYLFWEEKNDWCLCLIVGVVLAFAVYFSLPKRGVVLTRLQETYVSEIEKIGFDIGLKIVEKSSKIS